MNDSILLYNKEMGVNIMFKELGISGGTAIIVLIALFYIIKWAVKNAINESVLGQSKISNNDTDNTNEKK